MNTKIMAGAEENFHGKKPACACAAAITGHSFASVSDAVLGTNADDITATCDEIARADTKWMFLQRCRVCGTYWAVGCYDRGHVMFYYLFPAPQTDDPIRWLNEEAQELPAR
ncbi:MAG TPA: hypothetical protein VK893_04900 [Pyrinomonadaceae bacterium]|nr:hypothetical protein [Pyrinomonadaceae bacterium]